MMSQRRLSETTQARWLWVAACGVLILGSGAWLRPQERSIASARAQGEAFRRQDEANQRIIARIGSLQDEQRRAEIDLRHLAGEARKTGLTAQFILAVDRKARALRLDVIDVQPQATKNSEDSRIAELPVILRLRGRFQNMLRFLQLIAHDPLPIQVDGMDLTRTTPADGAGKPDLDATIRLSPFVVNAADLLSGGLNSDFRL